MSTLFPRECLIEHDPARRLVRPDKDTLAISPSGHFYVHYDLTGNAAPDLTDQDGNGTPDYVDEVGAIADSAHHVLVDMLGYEEESFDGEGGYDIYVMSYGSGSYGYCYVGGNGTSWIQIDNDYLGYDLPPIKIMQISLGHEYFHAIHFGYRSTLGSNSYFYEMSAMWFEDVLIPDGNDYLNDWADPFLEDPMESFDNTGNGYELALFGHYLSSFLDPKGAIDIYQSTIIREMWERFGATNVSAFSAVQHILDGENYSLTFIEAWIDFIGRNLYNGKYEDMENSIYYYEDQALISPISTSLQPLNENLSFNLYLDDKSVAIASYTLSELNSIIGITHSISDYSGKIVMVSTTADNDGNNLFLSSDTTFSNSTHDIHFIYGTENQASTMEISISLCQSMQIGDLNGDCDWTILDVVVLINCVLAANCADLDNGFGYAGDMDDNDVWNVLDIVALVNCVLAANCDAY